MTEPTLFGISKSRWDMVNGFAGWFAALGSFTAAAVALYLANRAARPSARVTVGHRIIVGGGHTKPYPEYCVFKIVNTGDRPIRVVQIGWKTGLVRKRYAIQLYDDIQSSPLPIELTHGQEASYYVPLSSLGRTWLEDFAKDMLLPHYRTGLWTLRARFYTSVDHVFEARPEENLMTRLRQACKKVSREHNTQPHDYHSDG